MSQPIRSVRAQHVRKRATGTAAAAFMALEEIPCSACGAIIPPGALFIRHTSRASRHAARPCCWLCAPFDLYGHPAARMSPYAGRREATA